MADKLKIALIGYGKMGKLIEKVALEKGHEIVSRINRSSENSEWENLKTANVAIEFTGPDSAYSNIKKCFDLGIPVVSGSTGWYHLLDELKETCIKMNATLLTASNFSIGVNLFFHINKILAKAMNSLPQYQVMVEEIHHTQKLDAPSGTAITIAEGILQNIDRKKDWVLGNHTESDDSLKVIALRKDDVPGTHMVTYSSDIDDIEIKHTAHNRLGFASGAVLAAEWLYNKKGTYTMNDIIGF